ncbi:hypothetical protein AB0E87_02390, partial [Streptomyces sp. NPDC029704]
ATGPRSSAPTATGAAGRWGSPATGPRSSAPTATGAAGRWASPATGPRHSAPTATDSRSSAPAARELAAALPLPFTH